MQVVCSMAHLTVLIDTLVPLRQCLVDACNAAESEAERAYRRGNVILHLGTSSVIVDDLRSGVFTLAPRGLRPQPLQLSYSAG